MRRSAIRSAAFALALLAGLSLVSCGGGHSHEYGPQPVDPWEKGGVSLLLSDCPERAIDALWVTVTEITALGENRPPQSLYRDVTGFRVDLLSLRAEDNEPLHDIIATGKLYEGIYPRFRLSIRDPEIVLLSGRVVTGAGIHFVGNGKVDVILREPLRLEPDGLSSLELEFDVEKSVVIPETASEKYILRPIIFATAINRPIAEVVTKQVELAGKIVAVRDDARGFTLDLRSRRGPVTVALADEGVIFDAHLRRTDQDAIRTGLTATVRGRLNDAHEIEAALVLLGETVKVRGIIQDDPVRGADGSASFTLAAAPLHPLRGMISVRANADAIVTFARSETVSLDLLHAGSRVDVRGRTRVENGRTVLDAILIDLTPLPLGGLITGVTPSDDAVTIALWLDLNESRSFRATDRTDIFLARHGRLQPADLRMDMRATFITAFDDPSLARAIVVESAQRSGIVNAVDADTRRIEILSDGALRYVTAGDATRILLMEEAGGRLIETPVPFERIEPLMPIEAFGIEIGNTLDATVILISPAR